MRNDMIIAVTGLRTGDNPQPGFPVIRSLRDAGFSGTIIGLVYDPLEAGIYTEGLIDHVYLMPYPSEGGHALISRLREIRKSHQIDLLLPTLDSEIVPYIRLQSRLEEMGIHTYLPTLNNFNLREKKSLERFADEHRIPVPRSKVVSSVQDVQDFLKTVPLPVMMKGAYYEAYKASSYDECVIRFNQIREKWGLPLIVQEFVPGQEYNVVAVGDGSGGVIGLVPSRKLVVTDKGKGFSGVTLGPGKITEFARGIIKALEWRGPLELEIMHDPRKDCYYLLEINPRFPAWCYLATGAGQNLPQAVVELAMEETVEPMTDYTVGALFIRHSMDIVSHIDVMGELTSHGELTHMRSREKGKS